MWKQKFKMFLLLALLLGSGGSLLLSQKTDAAAGINQQLAFEGKIVASNGTNIADGTYNMEFKIYNGGTSSGGGTLQWTEDELVGGTGGVTMSNGTFAINLGANTALSSVNWNSDTLWLSMQIGNTSSCTITTNFTSNCSGDGEMSPYIRLTSVPYAFNALQLGGVAASGYGTLAGTQTWAGTNSFSNSIAANAGLGITGLTTQSYGSATTANADSRTITNSNASSTLATVNGLNIALVGSANANSNKNVLNGINFPNVTTLANNSFTGLNFGTGYNSLLSYNGSTVINGTGVVQTTFGGTGLDTHTAANGSLLIGNGSGLALGTLTNNGGVTITNGAGSIGLAVAYGSTTNTAVQGSVTLACPTVSGNLGGGGGTITLGTGGSCTGITFTNTPTFSGLATLNAGITVTGGTADINSTGTSNTTIGNSTGSFTLNSSALDVSSAGAISGVTTLNASGVVTAGGGTFNGATSVTGTTTINTGTANALAITSGASVPGVDQFTVDNTASSGVTTAGVNGINVHYKGGPAAVEAAGMRVDYTPGTTSGGTWSGMRIVENTAAGSGVTSYGLKLEGGGSGAGTSTAVEVGTGWDIGVDIQSGGMRLAAQSDPATPAAGQLMIYAKDIAGRVMPKWIGPAGVDTPFQANLGFNRISWCNPAGGTTLTTFVSCIGSLFTNTGTANNPTPTSTNLLTSTRRATFATGTTAGTVASHRQSTLQVWSGNAAGEGGYFYTVRFGSETLASGNRAFVGLSSSVAAPTNVDPTTSATIGKIGVAINASTGDWNFVTNASGTAPTVTNLGANFPVNTTSLYELVLFSAPNGTSIGWRVTNISTGNQTSGSVSTNQPTNTTFLAPQLWITNNAAATNATLDFDGWYLESDN